LQKGVDYTGISIVCFCHDRKGNFLMQKRGNNARDENGKRPHWIALDFKVLIDASKATNGEPHKFDEIKWFTLVKKPENLHSQLPVFFDKYKDRL